MTAKNSPLSNSLKLQGFRCSARAHHFLLVILCVFAMDVNSSQAACPDYFNDAFNIHLDMSDSAHGVLSDIPALQVGQIDKFTYGGGLVDFNTTGPSPAISFLSYNVGGSIAVGTRYGIKQRIDSNYYKLFTIRMYSSRATAAQLYWRHSMDRFASTNFAVKTGWNTYSINLATAPVAISRGTDTGWTQGQPEAIELLPANIAGVNIKIDWVQLTPLGTNCADSTEQSLRVKTLQPDNRGGHDFAQETLGNAWNMNSSADVAAIYNVQNAAIYPASTFPDLPGVNPTPQTGNFLFMRNIPFNGDPNAYSILNSTSFDPSRYVNVCFRSWNAIEKPSNYNSVARVIWSDPSFGPTPNSYRDGDDIILARGAREYCLDMRTDDSTIQCNTGLYCPPAGTNSWTSIGEAGGKIPFLRIDLNENTEGPDAGYYSVLDYITLRTDHETPGNFAVVVDAPVSQQVNLYYNTVKSIAGGTLIGSLAAGRNSNTYLWNAGSLAAGRYYVFSEIIANGERAYSVSDGRVAVGPGYAADSTAPVISCPAPLANSFFDNYLQVSGYAVDETRLATVEVKIDGQYLSSLTPSLFNKEANDLYPNYADANYPGFNERLGTTAVGYGSHQITVTAHDTAGNQSSCVINNVTRRSGAQSGDVAYVIPNEPAFSIPLTSAPVPNTPVPAVPSNPTRVSSARHSSNGATTIKISGITKSQNKCTLTLLGTASQGGSLQELKKTTLSSSDVKRTSVTFKRDSLLVSKKGPAKVYLASRVTCSSNSSAVSSATSLSLKRGKRGVSSVSKVISALKRVHKAT